MSKRDWRYYRERQRGARAGAAQGSPETRARRSTRCSRSGSERRGFPAALEVEAGRAADAAEGSEIRRRDLTELPTFTIDPATARDFDDAISARREEDGARLWIHIADVAAHVQPGTPLDLEARRRANSTYVPGAVEPMLPRALSEDACSLAPGVERLAVTAEIELEPERRARDRRASTAAASARGLASTTTSSTASSPERESAPRRSPSRSRWRARRRRRWASGAGATSLDVESCEPEFRFDSRRQRRRRPLASRRPSPTA